MGGAGSLNGVTHGFTRGETRPSIGRMFIAIYTVCLTLGAGIAGSFGHAFLAEQGYIANFESAWLVTAGIAGAFAAAQLLFMALLNFVAPSRGGAPLLTEAISNAAAIVLLPFLLRVPLPWPHPKLAEMEVVLLPALFLGLHLGIKLFSLFAALHARPTTRLVAFFWGGCAVAAGVGAVESLDRFTATLSASRAPVMLEVETAEVKQVYATARAMREGNVFRVPLEGHTSKPFVLHVAFPSSEEDVPDKVHFVIDVAGTNSRPYLQTLTLSLHGWTTLLVPAQQIPGDATHCDVIWMREEEPSWMTRTRIRPVTHGGSELLIAGPWYTEQRAPETPKSIVLLLADGLAAEHTSMAGYGRETTPKLEEWAKQAVQFTSCMTPAPEGASALMSALTGASPLRHGFFNGAPGALAADTVTLAGQLAQRGYVCAAFSEGESTAGPGTAHPDAIYGSGFERGFQLFDQAYPMSPAIHVDGKAMPGSFVPSGSEVTLERVKEFVSAHRDVPFLAVVRLRELSTPRIHASAPGFVAKAENPKPVDVYDSALQEFDATLGEFLAWLDSSVPASNTCVAIAGAHGYDFRNGGDDQYPVYLNEPSLHVPLLIRVAGQEARAQRSPCSIEDLAPTLAAVAGVQLDTSVNGVNLFGNLSGKDPISVTGDPLALSLRTKHWRYTWQSGRDARTRQPNSEESPIEFISIADYERGAASLNTWSREKDLSDRYRQRLLDFLEGQQPFATAETAK